VTTIQGDPLCPQAAQNLTEAEQRLWRRLRRRQLDGYKVRRQHPIGIYVCDFICLEAMVIVELDGSQHLDRAPQDLHRDAFLKANGFRVLRFWNGDVLAQTENVLDTIFEALQRREMDGRFDGGL
jgi:very-short-patch-repair endonuclease